jgi:Fe-S cluster assembly iron-binding protein IscA
MGLALDEPKTNDERIDADGLTFVATGEVAEVLRSFGGVSIDYVDGPFKKGFSLALREQGAC